MNPFFPFFPALLRLISALLRLISALIGALLRLISALLRFISALANNTPNILLNILTLMNTFPFFPAFVRPISALLSFLNALLRLINALLGIECVDRYKLPPALFWRLQAHSWDNTAAVLAAGPGNKPFKK